MRLCPAPTFVILNNCMGILSEENKIVLTLPTLYWLTLDAKVLFCLPMSNCQRRSGLLPSFLSYLVGCSNNTNLDSQRPRTDLV